jgi:hypothetical protein
MVNPATGQKMVDYLTVFSGRSTMSVARESDKLPAMASDRPRDFTVEDAVIQLEHPAIKVNGSAKGDWGGTISGRAVWFYVEGHGRFVMTLAPHAALGFQKAGEVRANMLTIRSGYDAFEIKCRSDIAGDAVYNLYVHHDPAWRPRGSEASPKFLLGAGDQASSLVRR